MAILSITHDVEEAAKSDKVIVLNSGKKIEEGKPVDVFKDQKALEAIRLDAPFVYRLANALRERGIDVPSDIVSEEALARWLCR